MKRFFLLFASALFSFTISSQDIQLPSPQKTGGKPLMETLNSRQSSREYSNKNLPQQILSNLLWAAYGFNRADKRVVPSANNKQEFEIYVVLKSGIYLYETKINTLKLKSKGDYRKNTGKQDFVGIAPLNLIYVADISKASGRELAFADCGFISQNVYLFCASEGLNTVARGYFDKQELHKLLNLSDKQEIILTQTVGYGK